MSEKPKQHRIRLTLQDIKIIYEIMKVYDRIPDSDPAKYYKWRDYHDLKRRFACLEDNDGFYARRTR